MEQLFESATPLIYHSELGTLPECDCHALKEIIFNTSNAVISIEYLIDIYEEYEIRIDIANKNVKAFVKTISFEPVEMNMLKVCTTELDEDIVDVGGLFKLDMCALKRELCFF